MSDRVRASDVVPRTDQLAGSPPQSAGRAFFPAIGPVTTAVLFHGVGDHPAAPVDPRAWDWELDVLLRHRLAGLALAAAERCAVPLSREAETRLQEAHVVGAARALTVESTAVSALETLESRGIPFVITKGPGAALAYPHRSMRTYGDLDVLVPPERFNGALGVLRRHGFEEYFDAGEPRSYFDRHCREGVNLIRADGGSIDLHHRVPPWIWGTRLDFGSMLAGSRYTDVSVGRIPVLGPMHNLLVTALHVISDRRVYPGHKLITWRDVVSLAHACDPDVVVREARRVRLDWYLALILRQLPSSVRPVSLCRRLGDPPAGPADAFRLRRLLPPAIGSKHQIAQVFRLPLPNAAAFFFGYALPSRDFLRKRYGDHGSYPRWWREATGRLREARDPTHPGPGGGA